jgi:hypothetical protein
MGSIDTLVQETNYYVQYSTVITVQYVCLFVRVYVQYVCTICMYIIQMYLYTYVHAPIYIPSWYTVQVIDSSIRPMEATPFASLWSAYDTVHSLESWFVTNLFS